MSRRGPLPCRPLVSQPGRTGRQLARAGRVKHESCWVWMGPGTCHSPGWERGGQAVGDSSCLSRAWLVVWPCHLPACGLGMCLPLWGPVSSSVNNDRWTYCVEWMNCSREMHRTRLGACAVLVCPPPLDPGVGRGSLRNLSVDSCLAVEA